MTKDLAICVEGSNDVPREKYLTTMDFIKKVAEVLKGSLKKWFMIYVCTFYLFYKNWSLVKIKSKLNFRN